MRFTLKEFLAALPEITLGVKEVVVATYNNLDSHRQGGEFSTDDRKIIILCGGASHANLETRFGNVPNEGAQGTKEIAAAKVTDGLLRVSAESLVVLYAGTSRFGRMVKLAQRLATQGTKVALIACGCDDVFGGLEPNENIFCVMPTHGHCNGGRGDLSRIVERLM